MAQFPVASHCARASQVAPFCTGGTSVPGFAPTRTTFGTAGVVTSASTSVRPVSTPLTSVTSYVAFCSPGAPADSSTVRDMFIVGSSMRWSGGGTASVRVRTSVRWRVTAIC